MTPTSNRPTEIALPAAALATMRRSISTELGEDSAARVLRTAGNDAGDAFFQILSSDASGRPISDVDAASFWRRFAQLFSTRGWGSLQHSDVHPGIALLSAADWAESDNTSNEGLPSCYFTTGLLANVLGKVANGDVAVMEVECRSRGDAQCKFLFGSPEALRSVYDMLLNGATTEKALTQLA
jgi:predicted hydrocarbon binding protein